MFQVRLRRNALFVGFVGAFLRTSPTPPLSITFENARQRRLLRRAPGQVAGRRLRETCVETPKSSGTRRSSGTVASSSQFLCSKSVRWPPANRASSVPSQLPERASVFSGGGISSGGASAAWWPFLFRWERAIGFEPWSKTTPKIARTFRPGGPNTQMPPPTRVMPRPRCPQGATAHRVRLHAARRPIRRHGARA